MDQEEINEFMVGLSADPEFQPLLRPGSAALLWHAAPLSVLWASPAAQNLAHALSGDRAGAVAPSFPAYAQLSALALGRAPRHAHRLEKLRFGTSALAPLSTCACRRLTLPGGQDVLLTSFLGPPPRLTPQAATPLQETARDADRGQSAAEFPREERNEPAVAAEAEASPAPPSARPGKRIVRFVWETDERGRFVSVSDSLAEVVGAGSAAIVGMTIDQVLESRARDPLNIVSELFARGETWSGRKLFWRIDGAKEAVQVDFAGMSMHDRARNLVGFRGFGLCRTDIRVPWEAREPQAFVGPATEPPGEQLAAPHPAAAAIAGLPHGEARAVQADPVAEEAFGGPGETRPASMDEAAFPVLAFFTMGGTIGAWMAPGDPPPLMLIEDGPELDASVEDGSTEAHRAEAPRVEPHSEEAPSKELSESGETAGMDVAEDVPGTRALEAGETARPKLDVSDPGGSGFGESKPVDPPRSGVKPLSSAERSAFREIAKALGARFDHGAAPEDAMPPDPAVAETAQPARLTGKDGEEQEFAEREHAERENAGGADVMSEQGAAEAVSFGVPDSAEPAQVHDGELAAETGAAGVPEIGAVLDSLPFGVIVHRGETALFANRAVLDLIGYDDLAGFVAEGGLPRLFQARPAALAQEAFDASAPLAIGTRRGGNVAVELRRSTVNWDGAPAGMLTLRSVSEDDPDFRLRAMELDMLAREQRLREQSAILDTATDGVIVLDDRGRILSLNRAAEALFGYEQNEVAGEPLMLLLATESHLAALDYLEGVRGEGMQSILNDGREVIARVRQGGTIPLFMTMGRVGDAGERKFCAVLRDITAFKKAEGELLAAKRAAEDANAQKSDFLAKISHEIRTPLNAIIGFAEVMIEERFGAIGNERYRDYVADIHASGQHVISIVNDLLDLAKIEAGRMELNFTSVRVNELVSACVALLQPQAARDRIVLRTSFIDKLPPVVADERSLRQITLNLLSNAVKFTDAGGQVIVSTAMTDAGEVVFRVRDTGIGMSETEVEAALEPFRQLATSRKGGGTGLGLPLTKALVEANRGALAISSRKNEGTLVEVVFPPTRVLAE